MQKRTKQKKFTFCLNIIIKKISSFCEKIKKYFNEKRILRRTYNVISVLSTLTVFSGLLLFLYGNIVKSNQSDNDLIMKQIKKEVQNDSIVSLNIADIHGFGNNSIIVTTCNELSEKNNNNNLLILDSIDNEILRGMNDLLGTKSSYKVTFSYSLLSEDIWFIPETEYVLDILGDSTKEIIVKYYVLGSTYGANGTAIFTYSYEDEEYKIIGTYPQNEKMELYNYDEYGKVTGWTAQRIETIFDKEINNIKDGINCYDNNQQFNLNHGSWYGQEYWIDSTTFGRLLVTVNVDKYNEKTTYINIYETLYEKENDKLSWNLLFSDYVDDFPDNYTKDDLVKALMELMDCQVDFIESFMN